MARNTEFKLPDASFSASLVKIDRKKIYGWTDTKIYDDKAQECSLASLSDDGLQILTSGSTSFGYFDSSANYVPRNELIAVDEQGKPLEILPSVFDQAVILKESEGLDEYLSLNVESVYQLQIEENKEQILDILNQGMIFYFQFRYRADYESSDAYLISNEGEVFAVVGSLSNFEYIGLDTQIDPLTTITEEPEEEEDFDFGML